MQQLAPIILFAYNRPSHTRKALLALQKNLLAEDSILYVFSDGAKSHAAEDTVEEVRSLLREPWHFKDIHIVERPKNFGLAKNVIDGVSNVIKKHRKAIILEDDVLFSKYALTYFNEALTRYENEERVMHIGGFVYELDRSKLPETFFTRYVASQAWGTWQRAWVFLDEDINNLVQQFDANKIAAFTFDNTMNFWRQIQQQKEKKIDSWAVRWYASVFLHGGLALSPHQSLIENIGHDGTGVHSDVSRIFDVTVREEPIRNFPPIVEESKEGYLALRHYFKHRKGNIIERAIRFVRNKLNN